MVIPRRCFLFRNPRLLLCSLGSKLPRNLRQAVLCSIRQAQCTSSLEYGFEYLVSRHTRSVRSVSGNTRTTKGSGKPELPGPVRSPSCQPSLDPASLPLPNSSGRRTMNISLMVCLGNFNHERLQHELKAGLQGIGFGASRAMTGCRPCKLEVTARLYTADAEQRSRKIAKAKRKESLRRVPASTNLFAQSCPGRDKLAI